MRRNGLLGSQRGLIRGNGLEALVKLGNPRHGSHLRLPNGDLLRVALYLAKDV
jgi:hypothetical protein